MTATNMFCICALPWRRIESPDLVGHLGLSHPGLDGPFVANHAVEPESEVVPDFCSVERGFGASAE
jgi:hypothetical protein